MPYIASDDDETVVLLRRERNAVLTFFKRDERNQVLLDKLSSNGTTNKRWKFVGA